MSAGSEQHLDEALRALSMTQDRPSDALDLADRVLEGRPGPEAASIAHRVRGLALREIGNESEAETAFITAIQLAEESGSQERAAQARMSLALSLLYQGRAPEALRLTELAADILVAPLAAARLGAQRGLILQRLGRSGEAAALYQRALPTLRSEGDTLWVNRVLLNRGVLHAYRGDPGAAVADLTEAADLARTTGNTLLAAMAEHNLGFAYGSSGDVPAALRAFDEALDRYERVGLDAGLNQVMVDVDRAQVLLDVGANRDALRSAKRAVRALIPGQNAADLAEARLLLARAHVALEHHDEAMAEADLAARAFDQQDRPAWAAVARYVALLAQVGRTQDEGTRPKASLMSEGTRVAESLRATGWRNEALHASTVVARIALARGEPDRAASELEGLENVDRRSPAIFRAAAWHAVALIRLARGNRYGARRALTAGLRVIGDHQASLGASDLRSTVGGLAADLARTGLRMALEDRDATTAFKWIDHSRARALAPASLRPPPDSTLAQALAELRHLAGAHRQALLAGRSPPDTRRRWAQLERSIRDRLRHRPGASARASQEVDVAGLRSALGERELVAFAELDGGLWRVHVNRSGTRLEQARSEGLGDDIDTISYALSRLQRPNASDISQSAALAMLDEAAATVDTSILGELSDASTEIVIVPTGSLYRLPWGCLPRLRDRPFTLTPSARLWASRQPKSGDEERAVFIAGPDLPEARREVESLARRYPGASRLTGRSATADAVLSALERADVAHIAAHGEFRADNGLFSTLHLADGPLAAFELEAVSRPPSLVILSSCSAGESDVRAGDEILGMTGALLGLGTNCVVAPVVTVRDDLTRTIMTGFHHRLRRSDPSRALAATRANTTNALARATASAFVSFGRSV